MPSTSIRGARYDRQTRILSIWFVTSGRRYDYENVPPDLYEAFRQAFSKGRFFNAYIRDHYKYRLVEDGQVAVAGR
jgi:hypothetical protein